VCEWDVNRAVNLLVISASRDRTKFSDYTEDGKQKFVSRNNNNFKYNYQLMLVVLNCILLYYQNDGFTLPKPYFRVCFKNIYGLYF
jgi:hypothetical protein